MILFNVTGTTEYVGRNLSYFTEKNIEAESTEEAFTLFVHGSDIQHDNPPEVVIESVEFGVVKFTQDDVLDELNPDLGGID